MVAERILEMKAALREIMEKGYGPLHAHGFTLADIAADALGEPRKRRRGQPRKK